MTGLYLVYLQGQLYPRSTYPSLAHIRAEVLPMVLTSPVQDVTASWCAMVGYWLMATSAMREKSLMMWRRNVWIIRPHVLLRLSRHVIHPWRWQRYLPGKLNCLRLWHLTSHLKKVYAKHKILPSLYPFYSNGTGMLRRYGLFSSETTMLLFYSWSKYLEKCMIY